MAQKPNPAFGQQIKAQDISKEIAPGPGSDLVPKTLLQMSSVPGFVKLFGPYKAGNDQQRWADYQRFDWSVRQLPAINVFESQVEDKTSDQAWLNGTVSFQIFWPPNFRRSDLARIPAAFKAAMESFFASQMVSTMLDEIYFHQRPQKVFGLNEYGKVLNWTPSTEGLVEAELVPVTILDVKYRIDLRAYYRDLVFMGLTKGNPFEQSLYDLETILGEFDGVTDGTGDDTEIVVPAQLK